MDTLSRDEGKVVVNLGAKSRSNFIWQFLLILLDPEKGFRIFTAMQCTKDNMMYWCHCVCREYMLVSSAVCSMTPLYLEVGQKWYSGPIHSSLFQFMVYYPLFIFSKQLEWLSTCTFMVWACVPLHCYTDSPSRNRLGPAHTLVNTLVNDNLLILNSSRLESAHFKLLKIRVFGIRSQHCVEVFVAFKDKSTKEKFREYDSLLDLFICLFLKKILTFLITFLFFLFLLH